MRTLLTLLLAMLCAIPLTGAEPAMSETAYGVARADLQVIPRTQDSPRTAPGTPVDDNTSATDLGPVIDRATFPRWRRFVGDGVTCDLPDHPAVVVRPLKPNVANRIFAERMRTGPDQFDDGYAVDVNGQTVLTIMVAATARFDDSICFCGAVVLEVFRFDAGTLRRFDLLQSGEIKKVQALSRTHCATLMEWTHCRLHPDVYTRIALSLRPTGPALDERAAEDQVITRYGTGGQLGLLRPGMTRDDLITRLGAPFREEAGLLTWRWQQERWLTLTDVPLNEDGRFAGWQKTEFTRPDGPELPEPYGSIGWVKTTAEALGRPEVQQPFIETWCQRLLPTITDADLEPLFGILRDISKERPGSLDPALVQALVERYPVIGGHSAAWLLHLHGGKAGTTALIARIEHAIEQPTGAELDVNLMTFIGSDPRRAPLIAKLLAHPAPEMRREGWRHADSLTAEVIAAASLRDVSHPDRALRIAVADHWEDHAPAPAEVLAALQAQLLREDERYMVEKLRKAIAHQTPTTPAKP